MAFQLNQPQMGAFDPSSFMRQFQGVPTGLPQLKPPGGEVRNQPLLSQGASIGNMFPQLPANRGAMTAANGQQFRVPFGDAPQPTAQPQQQIPPWLLNVPNVPQYQSNLPSWLLQPPAQQQAPQPQPGDRPGQYVHYTSPYEQQQAANVNAMWAPGSQQNQAGNAQVRIDALLRDSGIMGSYIPPGGTPAYQSQVYGGVAPRDPATLQREGMARQKAMYEATGGKLRTVAPGENKLLDNTQAALNAKQPAPAPQPVAPPMQDTNSQIMQLLAFLGSGAPSYQNTPAPMPQPAAPPMQTGGPAMINVATNPAPIYSGDQFNTAMNALTNMQSPGIPDDLMRLYANPLASQFANTALPANAQQYRQSFDQAVGQGLGGAQFANNLLGSQLNLAGGQRNILMDILSSMLGM